MGNSGKNETYYPAAFDNVIGIGSVDKNYNFSNFNSKGAHIDYLTFGENIYSLSKNNRYKILSGSSMATAYGSSLIAMILSHDKNVNLSKIK